MSSARQQMPAWLAVALVPRSGTLLHAAVFGSVAAGSQNPADCDIVLVSSAGPNSDEWHALRDFVQSLCGDFFAHFGISLSVVLLTVPEWEELETFFKQRVVLFGDLLTRSCSRREKRSRALRLAEGSRYVYYD